MFLRAFVHTITDSYLVVKGVQLDVAGGLWRAKLAS